MTQTPDVLASLVNTMPDTENPDLIDTDADELLKAKFAQITPIRKIANGEIAGSWIPKNAQGPLVQAMTEHYPLLVDLGLGIYSSTHDAYVLFNPELLTEEQLHAFDKQGNLLQALPAFDSLLEGESPVPTPAEAATGENPDLLGEMAAPPPPASPAGQTGGPALSAGANASLANQRIDNASPKVPTERPRPGQGAVLNSVVQRAV